MKYDVVAGYNHYVFNNSEEAIIFAETVKTHYRNRYGHDEEIDVTISLMNEKAKETEE